MDPLSALSVATGIVTFVDFGAKLIALYSEIRKSENGGLDALSTLKVESRELSRYVTGARENVSILRERYPRQADGLLRLGAECDAVERRLRELISKLTVTAGQGFQGHLIASLRSLLKQGEIKALLNQLSEIRQQVMMSVTMCIWDDVAKLDQRFGDISRGVVGRRDSLRQESAQKHMRSAEPVSTAHALWDSIVAAHQADCIARGKEIERPLETENIADMDKAICSRIRERLEFAEMKTRENQIEIPFPATFEWLFDEGSSDARRPTGFKEWLESEANVAPFWITGIPASGKSTLMKFICGNPRLKAHLRRWSGTHQLLVCSVFFWNPGSLVQKTQEGLLRTMLHQLLGQKPGLCRMAVPNRYLYLQLAGLDAQSPPEWTIEELQDSISRFIAHAEAHSRLGIFIDGLDEFEGDHEQLISFLEQLHQEHRSMIKLCISSRLWNVFKDAFCAYPSLRMELFTKPDIEKYVRAKIGGCVAFKELRMLESSRVEMLESEIIAKAEGVFLWVVLVAEQIVSTARDNNDLGEIQKILNLLPPGLEKLYEAMRKQLRPDLRRSASMMHQLMFCWAEYIGQDLEATDFWAALGCSDPAAPQQQQPGAEATPEFLLPLERRLAGATGGMLQVVQSKTSYQRNSQASVQYLHRTVFDWLREIRAAVVSDGPRGYDPSLVLASVLTSKSPQPSLRHHMEFWGDASHLPSYHRPPGYVFRIGQGCHDSAEHRAILFRVIDRIQSTMLRDLVASIINNREGAAYFWRICGHSESVCRLLLAVSFACAPYIQALSERSPRGVDLEIPQRYRLLPGYLWGERGLLVHGLMGAAIQFQSYNATISDLNMKLRTFEALVHAQVVPSGILLRYLKEPGRYFGTVPSEFIQAIIAGLEGNGFTQLTSMPLLGRVITWDPRYNTTDEDMAAESSRRRRIRRIFLAWFRKTMGKGIGSV